MNAQDIRNKYLEFYQKRQHAVIPRASLVPADDPTTLFTGSGMQPLISYLLGEKHPKGKRLVDSQTCFRADDIEEVGDNRHTTFFEMLGNWSLGDYFQEEQIPWIWEFLTDVVGLDPAKLYVTTFIGDEANGIPKDTISADIWQRLYKEKGIDAKAVDIGSEEDGYRHGMQDGRIFYYDASKNWWSRAGKPENMPAGEPGGPDTEIFYLFEDIEHDPVWGEKCHPNCDCGRFIEISNSVFMAYQKIEDGKFESLPNKNVDFGGGLERIAMAAIDSPDAFKVSLLWPIIEHLEKLTGKSYKDNTESMRVIADHFRAATFLAVDGVKPSNTAQGYVLRRLVRRAVRFAFDLDLNVNVAEAVVPIVADLYHDDFPEVAEKRDEVIETLIKEEKVFRQTLRKGLKVLIKKLASEEKENQGKLVFEMYDTYGFPKELTIEEMNDLDFEVDKDINEQFDKHMQAQRDRSRTAAKGQFVGGLGGHSMIHKKYHTATHLMYQSLRNVLGDHVVQHGSNITEERLRFDFSHPEKVTPEQVKRVEDMVNEQIKAGLEVSFKEYSLQDAQAKGVLGQFGDRYGEIVKVYTMTKPEEKPFSFEICGGPHADNTNQLAEAGKQFKITKEQASSAGIRRIKAVLV